MADDIRDLKVDETFQSGSIGGSRGDPEWNLYDGDGPRRTVYHIRFGRRFRRPPTVALALSGIDILNNSNSRLTVGVERVTEDGFDAVFSTWAGTSVWAAQAVWVAHG